MAHPQMFDDDDPVLARVKEAALALPDAAMKVSHGRPAFYTTKVFAYYGCSLKVDDGWEDHPHALTVLLEPAEREAMLAEGTAFVPMYLGPSGWVSADIGEHVGWDEVGELLDASYRRTAGVRRVAALDAQNARS